MLLNEGRNNWANFGQDHLKSIELNYDGGEKLSLVFHSESGGDRCEVTLDWEEEIKSFKELFEELYHQNGRQCKRYPDDFRGLMMRGAYFPDRFEMTFLKNYQCVQVVMGLEKAQTFLATINRMLKEPGEYKVNF